MKVMHVIGHDQSTACGQWASHDIAWTSDPEKVTCKRCLVSRCFKEIKKANGAE